jgi:hypothetical protein
MHESPEIKICKKRMEKIQEYFASNNDAIFDNALNSDNTWMAAAAVTLIRLLIDLDIEKSKGKLTPCGKVMTDLSYCQVENQPSESYRPASF